MRRNSARLALVGALVVGAFAVTMPSTSAASRQKLPDKIVAKGTLPPGPEPTFGDAAADGSLPFTATYQMEGDLTGDVSGKGSMVLDGAAKTFAQHDTTGTFVGTLKGVGPVTLAFVTAIPPTQLTAAVTESGTATATTGKVKGYKGTIVNKFTVGTGGPGAGTYTVTLRKQK